jgi:LacI family transcriptional regulator
LILKVEDFDHSESEIQSFLKDKKVDAVFAVNEHFAIYAIKAIKEQGLDVPGDVSVIAFTDGELSKHFMPSLTTINQHGEEMGAQAARLLIKKLENEEAEDEPFETIIIGTSLVERNSTKH